MLRNTHLGREIIQDTCLRLMITEACDLFQKILSDTVRRSSLCTVVFLRNVLSYYILPIDHRGTISVFTRGRSYTNQ